MRVPCTAVKTQRQCDVADFDVVEDVVVVVDIVEYTSFVLKSEKNYQIILKGLLTTR